MDMRLKEDFLDRWKNYFGGAELPITCWYTDDEGAAVRAEPAKGHRCFIADLAKIRKGESLLFDVAAIGCSGGKRYLGFTQGVPPNFEHFLSCGIPTYIDDRHSAHNKIIIIDQAIVITGSFNFTKAAEGKNAENLVVIKGNAELSKKFLANFREHLGHSEKYEGRN